MTVQGLAICGVKWYIIAYHSDNGEGDVNRMFEQDYIMRMIKGKTAALARIIFRKTSPQYELPEENKYTAADDLFARLVRMADAGAVNKAENMLYQELDQ